MDKKKLVVLTGSGISSESGIPTFRIAADSLWENYDVKTVCTHNAWELNPEHVNKFYNMLRVKYQSCKPNEAHNILKELENDYDVTIITQNVDNLHEQAGSSNVLHLHGELMKCCSEKNTEDESCWVNLPKDGFGESGLEIPEGELANDNSLLRPYIVFFDEMVPNIVKATEIVSKADIFVVIGTSLQVYPAAGLIDAFDIDKPLIVIDPDENVLNNISFTGTVLEESKTYHIKEKASEGARQLVEYLKTL